MAEGGAKTTRLGGFEVLGKLGKGGMGTVLKARQVSMDRLVALKILPKKLAEDERFVQRFLREARSAARLRHPNIVQAHDVGFVDGYYFFAMEFVDGQTLSEIVGREGPLEANRALDAMKQVASALAAAHKEGIVHRDIKPANIMIDKDGQVRVTDFGLAKRTEGDVEVTADGAVVGTPAYVAPEMAKGGEADHRSDLYSLGATVFCALAGRPPFEGKNFSEIIVKQVNEPAPPLASLAPRVDRRLCHIVDRLLRKNPEARYPSATALLDDLNGLGKLQSVAAAEKGTFSFSAKQPSAPQGGEKVNVPFSAAARAEGRAMLAEAPTLEMTEGKRREREALGPRPPASGRRRTTLITVGAIVAILAIVGIVVATRRSKTLGPMPDERGGPRPTTSTSTVTKPVVPPTSAPRVGPVPPKKPITAVAVAKKGPTIEPEPPTPKPGEWVDLFDGKSLKGWKVVAEDSFAPHERCGLKEGHLFIDPQGRVTGICWDDTFPTQDYEVAFEAARLSGSDSFCAVLFPVGKAECVLLLGGYGGNVVGIGRVDGRTSNQNPTTTRASFRNTQWYRIRLRVTQARIETWLDEEKIIDFETAGHTFDMGSPQWAPLRPFGIAANLSQGAVRNIRLRRIEPGTAEGPKPGEWQSLFDGKTLAGWRAVEEGAFANHGNVGVENGLLVLGGIQGRADGVICTGQFPSMNYEVEIEAQAGPWTWDFCNIGYPIGSQAALLKVGGGFGGKSGIGFGEVVSRRPLLEPGQWFRIRLRVTEPKVEVWVNDERIIEHPTQGQQFIPSAYWAPLKPFGIGAWSTTGRFRNIRLRRIVPGVAAAPKAGECFALSVIAPVDGVSDLVIAPTGVHWEHRGKSRPGTPPGAEVAAEPTVVNGERWFPKWQGNTSDAFKVAGIPASFANLTCQVTKVRGRGTVQLVTPAEPQPTQFVVRFSDPARGANEFEARILIGTPAQIERAGGADAVQGEGRQ